MSLMENNNNNNSGNKNSLEYLNKKQFINSFNSGNSLE